MASLNKKTILQDVSAFKDDQTGTFFLRIEYLEEDEKEIRKVIFPKVDSNIPNKSYSLQKYFGYVGEGRSLPVPNRTMMDFTDFQHLLCPDENGNTMYIETVKTKIHEMTVEEIEDLLGYKIKIIQKESDEE